MEPMDYTMDNSSNVLADSRYQQCQQQPSSQPHSQTNGPSFAAHGPSSQTRNTQHYDPVHESSAWFPHNQSSFPQQPPVYPGVHNPPQWSSVPQPESAAVPNWSHFSEMDRRNPDHNSSGFRHTAFLPWGPDPRSFGGHPGYAQASVTGSSVPTEPTLQPGAQSSLRGYDSQQQYLLSREMARASIPPRSTRMFAPSNFLNDPAHASPPVASPAEAYEPSSITPQPASFTSRAGLSRTTRPNSSRPEESAEVSRRRRLAATWDSDDDEESLADLDRADLVRRHAAAEALFGGEYDDERSIAALRGAVAGGKRVPSKEALESLETLKLADLTDADRTCIICYNEFGVSNPEGEIENPIRLPKCKHIFGDKCIKKWFEDSDSCPYCRDKLPSELAVRKHLGAYQSYRFAHREQLRLASLAQRSRYSSYTPSGVSPIDDPTHRSPSTAQRTHEEYEFMLARQNELINAHRNPNADSPERRRQARGRHGAVRGPHFLGRPTSVGSVRTSNPSLTNPPARNFADLYGTRRNATSDIAAAARENREARDHRADIRASVLSASSTWGASEGPGSTHPNPSPPYLLAGASVPREEASPPVAVGSGVPGRRQVGQFSASRLSVGSDSSDLMYDSPGNPRSHVPASSTAIEIATEAHNQRQAGQPTGIPSFGALLQVSNNLPRYGSDSSSDADEPGRINRMDGGMPQGWGSIN